MRLRSTFGIAARSSFCTYPSRIILAAIQSETTWRSRPPESPWAYCCWTLPKNSWLSLISSAYFTLVPYSRRKRSSVRWSSSM